MKDKVYRREQREKRKLVKEFMKTDVMEKDDTLISIEQEEDALDGMNRFIKYEMEMR